MANLIKIDRNGSKHWEGMITCDRCGGVGGADQWQYTGYTCYKCGGTGKVFAKWIERTPEYEAKLIAKRKAKLEAKQAEQAEEIRKIQMEQERLQKEQEAKEALIKAQKAVSQYVGAVGAKIVTEAVFEHTATVHFRMGWMEQTMHIHSFRDSDGNLLVWKTSSNGLWDLEEGCKVKITATVKEHAEYRDEKQTVLTRCKIVKI